MYKNTEYFLFLPIYILIAYNDTDHKLNFKNSKKAITVFLKIL